MRTSAQLDPVTLTVIQVRPRSETQARNPDPSQGVWASMYNERAMLSMKKVGIDFRDIRMAVLCQRVVQVRTPYLWGRGLREGNGFWSMYRVFAPGFSAPSSCANALDPQLLHSPAASR